MPNHSSQLQNDSRPVIKLMSVAGSDADLPVQLAVKDHHHMVDLIQRAIGNDFKVQVDLDLLTARADPLCGGRDDDAQRAHELQSIIEDDNVIAAVSLRGGSWLTRILADVNFDRLADRKNPMLFLGFSELTTIVNIIATYESAYAFYDTSPGFLLWGFKTKIAARLSADYPNMSPADVSRQAYQLALEEFSLAFVDYFKGLARWLNDDAKHELHGILVRGRLPDQPCGRIVGGCLSVLVTLLGSPFQKVLHTRKQWLLIEDISELPHRIDRYLAQLKLAGVFQHCQGIILGDFHNGPDDQSCAVLALLDRYVDEDMPVIACHVGHCLPGSRVPINRPMDVVAVNDTSKVQIVIGREPIEFICMEDHPIMRLCV